MPELFINKKTAIQAPAPKVWKVLVQKQYIQQWIYEFSESTVVTEDWQLNKAIAMTDDDGTVLLEGTITEFEPNHLLKIEFKNSGYTEKLTLTAKDSLTVLSIHAGPITHSDYEVHSKVWEKGLNKIKKLSESL